MKTDFGVLPSGERASLYTIHCDGLTACVTDYGATLVRLLVPDRNGKTEDIVTGYDDVTAYARSGAFFGATVGRNANRIKNACFVMDGTTHSLSPNFWRHNLHSGPNFFHKRLWQTEHISENAVTFFLFSPHGDQGFPGNAEIRVTYTLEYPATLKITYQILSDRNTVFNPTNHTCFNLAGHHRPQLAMEQILMLPARSYTLCGMLGIPTGKMGSVNGTPLDFRTPKALGADLRKLKSLDHNFEVFCDPCALLTDPHSGRTMAVSTDCPGIQVYTPNSNHHPGKDGVDYTGHYGVCLETQFYPDALHHPQWQQPIVKAGFPCQRVTRYRFSW